MENERKEMERQTDNERRKTKEERYLERQTGNERRKQRDRKTNRK